MGAPADVHAQKLLQEAFLPISTAHHSRWVIHWKCSESQKGRWLSSHITFTQILSSIHDGLMCGFTCSVGGDFLCSWNSDFPCSPMWYCIINIHRLAIYVENAQTVAYIRMQKITKEAKVEPLRKP